MLHPRLIKLEVVAEVYLGPCQMSMMNPNLVTKQLHHSSLILS